MPDDIKQRIIVDAEEALRKLKELTGVEHQLNTKTKEGGEEADKAKGMWERFGGSIKGTIGSLIGFTSIGAAVVMVLKEIANAAQRAAQETANFGNNLRQIVNNVGAAEGSRLGKQANALAAQMRMSPEQRNELLAGTAVLTDLQRGGTPASRDASQRELARLMKTTGVSGGEGARVMAMLQATGGLTPQQAADYGAGLLTGGMSAHEIVSISQRTGGAAPSVLERIYSAKGTGMAGETTRQTVALINAIQQTDERGRLAPALRGAGITPGMDAEQRLAHLMANADRLGPGRLAAAIGGGQNLPAFEAMQRADRAGLTARARAELRGGGVIAGMLGEQGRSPEVRIADVQAAQRMRLQEATESQGCSTLGQALGEQLTQLGETPGAMGIPWLGGAGRYVAAVATMGWSEASMRAHQYFFGPVYNQENANTRVNPRANP